MQEVTELVLLHSPEVFGDDTIRRQVAYIERARVEVLPVLGRNTARVEQLEVRAKSPARVRDRLITRGPRCDASPKHRDVREPVAAVALNIDGGFFFHARTHTFCPQSARI